MYSFETLLTISLITLIAGFVAGTIIGLRKSPAAKAEELEKQITDMRRQQEDYQHEVTEHFVQTAELLDKLTDSYRDVHNHLAQGAQTLVSGEASHSIQSIADDEQEALAEPTDTITPPLDYAPKTGDETVGMLNEEFGLEKNADKDDAEPHPSGNVAS